TLFLLITSTLSLAQTDSRSVVSQYLTDNGTLSYYSDVVDKMYEFIQQEFSGQDIPSDVWAEVRNGKEEAMTLIESRLVQAYQSHFSEEELKTMTDFYVSETGMKIVRGKDLNPEEKSARDNFYASATGQKIKAATDSLNSVLAELTQAWSSEIYASAVGGLNSKGYTKN
ncbi:MAG: DUF2059 domain-containing protein, partial [Flavobacteriaceae bacterium]|nr:DUF2059 domain-containing protein [Flavobacteriaceae bacterium]